MLDVLERADRMWPTLLKDPELWTSVDVNYEPPRVERIWCPFGNDFRLFLHRIHPCEQALYHPHPWPSAIKVLSGVYEMRVGYGDAETEPRTAATVLLTAGSSYEMVEPNGWHSVRPINMPSLSIMVTGRPWEVKHLGEKRPPTTLGPLQKKDVDYLISLFSRIAFERAR
jgi:hypothetical protein